MDKPTIEKLEELATRANGARRVKDIPGPAHVALLEARDGTLQTMIGEPEPRNHLAFDLSAVAEFANANEGAAIWYSRAGVVCLTDDDDRRDKVSLKLSLSPPLLQLMAFEQAAPALKQAALVLLLRTVFAGCLPNETLLVAVRNLKFKMSGDGSSNLQHGSASIGRSLQQELTGAKSIPEEIAFDVPIFANVFRFTGRIRCAIDIDPATETFKVLPLPLEIERAIVSGENGIFDALAEQLNPQKADRVYYGSP